MNQLIQDQQLAKASEDMEGGLDITLVNNNVQTGQTAVQVPDEAIL